MIAFDADVLTEILRGNAEYVRRAAETPPDQQSFQDFRSVPILGYDAAAHQLFLSWRQQKIRVPTHDLRIAASCVAHGVRLISRNRRDFELVPGLDVEFWK